MNRLQVNRLQVNRLLYFFGVGILIFVGCMNNSSSIVTTPNPTPTLRKFTITEAISILEAPNSSGVSKIAVLISLETNENRAEALDILIDLMENDRIDDVQWSAALVIGLIGPEAESAIPNLFDAIDNPDSSSTLQSTAADAIAQITTPEITQKYCVQFAEHLNHDSTRVRDSMITSLGKMEQNAMFAVPKLMNLVFTDPRRLLRGKAAYSVQVITNQSFSDIPNDPYWESGFAVGVDNDDPFIALAAIKWWEAEGQNMEWPETC